MRRYSEAEIIEWLGPDDDPAATGGGSSSKERLDVSGDIKKGDRHTLIYKFLRSQKARGVSLDVALLGCHGLNQEKCSPPLERAGLDEYLRRVWNQSDSPEYQRANSAAASGFVINGKGDKVLPKNQENVARALEKLGVELRFNLFSQKPIVKYNGYTGPYQDEQRNRIWLDVDKQFGFQSPPDFFDVVTQDLARQQAFHPVRDYLSSLEWDQVPRIDEWLIAYGGAGDSEYTRAVSSLMLIAAVRRVFHPGCKFDEILVLESDQGLGKSSALVALCPDETWFSDDLPLNVDAKQIIERTTGKWIIEAAELSGMHSSKVEHLKAMLSRMVDGPVRMAYARLPVEQPRQFIIVGSTNAHNYLDDSTGNRRFWPVRVHTFDIAALKRDRDQLWAEAVARERAGASIRLDPKLYDQAGLQQERRRTNDPWETLLDAAFEDEYQRVPPNEIWRALGIPPDRLDVRHQKRVVQIMQRLGFKRQACRDPEQKGRVVMGWARGQRLTDHSPQHDLTPTPSDMPEEP